MGADLMLLAAVAGPILGVIAGFALERFFERRPRLVYYLGHASEFVVPQPPPTPSLTVHTHAVVIRNIGRLTAHNVRVGHRVLPQNITVFPYRPYTIETLPEDHNEIVLETLAPNDQITISYLYFPPLYWHQINSEVRCDEGLARLINVLPTREYPKWALRLMAFFLWAGVIAVAYLFVKLAIFLWHRAGGPVDEPPPRLAASTFFGRAVAVRAQVVGMDGCHGFDG